MRSISIYLLAAILLFACTTRQPRDGKSLYVSIQPLRSLVEGIVGDDFNVEVLVPAGASPETFEPTPRQYVGLNRSELIFNVGLIDFETSLLSKIEDRGKVIDLSRGIDPITGTCSHGHQTNHRDETNAHGHVHGVDPHVWTSPKALQRMAANAYDAIRRRYPDSTKYTDNFRRLQLRLEELDKRTAEKIAAGNVRYFIIYHPAYSYYARDYGVRQEAIEADGKEPSAKRIAQIIRGARQDSIRKIFYQSQFPASTVEVIARDAGAQAIAVDPLREDVIEGIDAFTELLITP